MMAGMVKTGVLEPKPEELPLASQQIQKDKW